jgi:hypothetical protein
VTNNRIIIKAHTEEVTRLFIAAPQTSDSFLKKLKNGVGSVISIDLAKKSQHSKKQTFCSYINFK